MSTEKSQGALLNRRKTVLGCFAFTRKNWACSDWDKPIFR
jgi:hypothetical protein